MRTGRIIETFILTGRIALRQGRGAACFSLPQDLPTGNYKLISYTAQSRNEIGTDPASEATLISVINTSSAQRSLCVR